MAYAPQRSLSDELAEGRTDGVYKKVIRDRGGFPEDTTARARNDLADTWYGIHEDPTKVDQDGRVVRTPNFRPTKPVSYPGS
jgi:hypothetical protein